MSEPSIQEQYFPTLTCFGCGPANPKGLRLRSYAQPDGSTRAVFQPWPEHDNGLGYLNGGIIATLLDCHSATPMLLRAGTPGAGTLPYVTAGLDVKYRRPAPLPEPLDLIARVVDVEETAMTIEVELWWEDKVRASATAVWKRWRPRPVSPAAP